MIVDDVAVKMAVHPVVTKIRGGYQSAVEVFVVEDVYVGADWWCCQSPGGL